MNITKEISTKFQYIDLSTDAAVVERYEALFNSPLLFFLLHPANCNDMAVAYRASKNNPAAIARILKGRLRDYATIGRILIKRSTIKAIRSRIGLLFAEWDAEEQQGGSKASDGYLYEYAIERGFNPQGATLSETDSVALDDLAECIFTAIESYFIYSLSGVDTAVDEFLNHSVGNVTKKEIEILRSEAEEQLSVLFAPEWENAEGEFTTSFHEEVNFFGAEASLYAHGVFRSLGTDPQSAAKLRQLEGYLIPDKEEAASMKQAQGTKYKDYINANTIC